MQPDNLAKATEILFAAATKDDEEVRYTMFVEAARLIGKHYSTRPGEISPQLAKSLEILDSADKAYQLAKQQLAAVSACAAANVARANELTQAATATANALRDAPSDATRRAAFKNNARALTNALIATDIVRASQTALRNARKAKESAFAHAIRCAKDCAAELTKLAPLPPST